MKLSTLLRAVPDALQQGSCDAEVRGIVSDSRRVQPGDLFVAYPGVGVDGRSYIQDAIKHGAAAVVAEVEADAMGAMRASLAGSAAADYPLIGVGDGRAALSHLAAAWHDFPSRKLTVIGVTGTDGKTTTASLICSILQTAGFETGLISTVAAFIGEKAIDTGFHTTTPDAPELQAYLADMVAAGAHCAVVESTSLGLAQKRLADVDYDAAVVTNITHEHLNDHHDSFAEYRAAKRMLFEQLLSSTRKPGVPKVSILNADDSSFDFLKPIRPDVQLSYGVSAAADVRAEAAKHSPAGLRFRVHMPDGKSLEVESPLIGLYNVSNILAAVTTGYAQGIASEIIQKGVRQVQAVPGRMERINRGQPFTVIVDFAHTPNALDNALQSARSLTSGRVTVVFGCAGRRDVQKRPLMGECAGRLADHVVLTAEDPRTESLDDIMRQIATGVERAGGDYVRIDDRQAAIAHALGQAQPGDLVIIAGKGHERSMCFGTTEFPWSDQDAVKSVLDKRNS
jgi:UDP-N-acetylmuramoyl-L-alanyl-D-glutamate--2,6-diaminopimelate ligase